MLPNFISIPLVLVLGFYMLRWSERFVCRQIEKEKQKNG